MNPMKVPPTSLVRPRRIRNIQPKRPCPLPNRPLPLDRFRPPRGQKQVFLPNFVITFLHTPTRPPNYATFLVPLWFSKLDLKDYLWNLYGVPTLGIRSYVIQSPVQEGKPGSRLPTPRQWFRPMSRKKMTVELAYTTTTTDADGGNAGGKTGEGGREVKEKRGQGPFVWPEEPKEWRPWAREEFRKAEKEQEDRGKNHQKRLLGREWDDEGTRKKVGDKARELLRKAGRAVDPV